MSIINKTDFLLNSLIYCDLRTSVGVERAKQLIRKSLREQDRDTRHACAEACLSCGNSCHEKCMNCHRGL